MMIATNIDVGNCLMVAMRKWLNPLYPLFGIRERWALSNIYLCIILSKCSFAKSAGALTVVDCMTFVSFQAYSSALVWFA